TLPFANGSFSIGLFADVLHHVPEAYVKQLLREAARVCHILIIKDHVESGLLSRQILRLMDYVGNAGYGISVPRRYLTPTSFAALLEDADCLQDRQQIGVDLYGHLPVL